MKIFQVQRMLPGGGISLSLGGSGTHLVQSADVLSGKHHTEKKPTRSALSFIHNSPTIQIDRQIDAHTTHSIKMATTMMAL